MDNKAKDLSRTLEYKKARKKSSEVVMVVRKLQ